MQKTFRVEEIFFYWLTVVGLYLTGKTDNVPVDVPMNNDLHPSVTAQHVIYERKNLNDHWSSFSTIPWGRSLITTGIWVVFLIATNHKLCTEKKNVFCPKKITCFMRKIFSQVHAVTGSKSWVFVQRKLTIWAQSRRDCYVKELKQTTTKTATLTPPNKEFNEQSKICIVNLCTFLCPPLQKTTWNDEVYLYQNTVGRNMLRARVCDVLRHVGNWKSN